MILLSYLLQSQTTTDKTANVVLDIESLVQSSDKTSGSPKMTVSDLTLVNHPIRRIYSVLETFLLLSFRDLKAQFSSCSSRKFYLARALLESREGMEKIKK